LKHFKPLLCFFLLLAMADLSFGDTMYVEVINDSDVPDQSVYLLLSGQHITNLSSSVPYVDLGPPAPTNTVYCASITNLAVNGTIVSQLTGKLRTNYTFSADYILSGELYFSFDPALKFVGKTAPTLVENYRYDKMELDYSYPGIPVWNADITAVDFLGIPMQIEAIDDGTGEPIESRTFYASLPSMLQMVSPAAGAIQYNTTNKAFLRLLSPSTLSSHSKSGSAAPYPSFTAYVKNLVSKNYKFITSGNQGYIAASPTYVNDSGVSVAVDIEGYSATYNFNGSFSVKAKTGEIGITLKGKMSDWQTNSAPSPGPPRAVSIPPGLTPYTNTLPNATSITMNWTTNVADQSIYGAALGAGSFTVSPPLKYPPDATKASSKANYFNAVMGNSIYSWIVGNVDAGLNLGYFGGRSGNNTSNWFTTVLPPANPFGAARPSNDGFYNPYAAMIFNCSDTYGFAFSDRATVGTNPLLAYDSSKYVVRITLLPKRQLDAPLISGTPMISANNSVSFKWPAITNAKPSYTVSYLIDSIPPLPGGTMSVNTPKATLTNLISGLPYLISVRAQAVSTNLATTNLSLAIPFQAISANNFNMPGAVGTGIGVQFSAGGWTSKVFGNPANYAISIGGTNNNPPLLYTGAQYLPQQQTWSVAGTNYYPVTVYSANGTNIGKTILYQTLFKVVFSPASTNNSYVFEEQPVLYGTPLSDPPSVAHAGGNITNFPSAPITDSSAVVSATSAPNPQKIFDKVVFPK
jgi:hypothetical protein